MTDERPEPRVAQVLSDIFSSGGRLGDLKSDRIVVAFERQILSGALPSGMRLPTEGELCELLGVSRSVIRDSVRTLVARGLLTVRQGRGTTVAEPSDAAFSNAMLVLLTRSNLTMGDVIEARATIETSLVSLAAQNRTAEDCIAIEAAHVEFAEAVARGDDAAATESHAAFHTRVLEAVHQPALTLMLRPMTALTIASAGASVLRTMSGDWEVEAHVPIVEALKAGDPERATRAMATHYEVATNPEPYNVFLQRLFAEAYFSDDPR